MGDHSDPKKNQVPNGVFGDRARARDHARAIDDTAAARVPESEDAAPHIVHIDGRPALYGNQSGTYRVDAARCQQVATHARESDTRALEQAIESELKTWSEPGLRDEDIEVDESPSVIVDWGASGRVTGPGALQRDLAGHDEDDDWQDDATTASGWRSERRSSAAPTRRGAGARRWAVASVFGVLLAGAAGIWWSSAGTRRVPSEPSAAASSGTAQAEAPAAEAAGGVDSEDAPAQATATQKLASSMPRRAAIGEGDPSADDRVAAREAKRQRPVAPERSRRHPNRERTRGVDEAPEPAAEPATEEAEPKPTAGSDAPTSAEEAAGAPELPETLSRSQVRAGMEALRPRMEACAAGRHGVAEARVTITSSGKLAHAVIGDDFRGTEQGSCMARALRGARFPAFEDGPLEVRYPFSL